MRQAVSKDLSKVRLPLQDNFIVEIKILWTVLVLCLTKAAFIFISTFIHFITKMCQIHA